MADAAAQQARAWLRREARPVAPLHWLAVAAGLGHAVAVILQAGLSASVVAALVAGESPSLVWSGVALATVVLLRGALLWLWQWAGGLAGRRVCEGVRRRLLDHLGEVGPRALAGLNSAGIASRVVEQSEALEGYFARYRPQEVLAVAIPLAVLAVVVWLDWLAAILLLFAAPLIPAFMALVGLGAEQLNRRQFRALTYLAGHFLDRVRGLPTLQLFGHTDRSVEEVYRAADGYRQRSLRTLRVAFLSSAVLEFFSSVAIAMVAIYIGFALLGYIEFGPAPGVTAFSGLFVLLLAPEFFQPLRSLSQHYHDRAAALGAATELDDLLRRAAPLARVRDPELTDGVVRVVEAGVSDAGRGALLAPVTLTAEPGDMVVVTGPSGVGKSTLLRLIAGLEAPDTGTVRVGGEVGVAWLGQRPFLMQGTIAENIALGSPEPVTEDAIAAAAAAAGVERFARTLPAGLATPLGERGSGLSGGQAQRVALARVFLSSSPVVVLDEPTTALDPVSEAAVLAALERLRGEGRTLVIASHHASVRDRATRVITLHGGRGDG